MAERKTRTIPIKGDPYLGVVKLIGVHYNLTESEIKVLAELLRNYERYLSQSSHEIAWEILNSSRANAKIREKLSLTSASFNNLKTSLKKKGCILENSLAPIFALKDLTFVFEDEAEYLD
jgi:hypothetical protein